MERKQEVLGTAYKSGQCNKFP